MSRYCFALDLKNDATLIDEYERHHKNVWPEILDSLKAAGIEQMEIYRTGNRLFMIIDASDIFSLEKMSMSDPANQKVQEWEALMWKYQQALPQANPGEKWVPMTSIFMLTD